MRPPLHSNLRCRFVLIIGYGILAGLFADLAMSAGPVEERLPDAPKSETLTVELGADAGPVTHRASGFCRALTPQEPPQAIIEPLRPQLLRQPIRAGGGRYDA